MMWKSILRVAAVTLLMSAVLSVSLPRSSESGAKQRVGVRGGVVWRPLRPKPEERFWKAILLILRQKCQEWRDKGLPNLPFYCYYLLRRNRGKNISLSALNRYYKSYTKTVSAAERRRDLQRATATLRLNNRP